MQTAKALTRLQSMLSWSNDPVLTSPEVADLLGWSARADASGEAPWSVLEVTDAATTATVATVTSASAAFVASDLGLLLQVLAAGTTEASLDATVSAVVSGTQVTASAPAGETLTNATLLLYRANGAWVPTYALQWAAAEGWRWKAGKCAERYKFQAGGGTFNRDQTFNHCIKMAQEYERRANNTPQSIRSIGNLVLDRLGGFTAVPWWYDVMGN